MHHWRWQYAMLANSQDAVLCPRIFDGFQVGERSRGREHPANVRFGQFDQIASRLVSSCTRHQDVQ
jgi:hypothetical protein